MPGCPQVAISQECRVNISWVISESAVLDPLIRTDQLKQLGSIWGSWKTWRSYQTDNVVCYDMLRADELIKRNFYQQCNFYIANSHYGQLGNPAGVKVYEGNFDLEIDNPEDIIAMHLAASVSNIVLLLGFDLGKGVLKNDKLAEHRAHNYRSLTKQAIKNNPDVQWVLIDSTEPIRKDLLELPNLGTDTLANILSAE
jgi:hypothetical protein